jgi:hypothetical protein
MDEGQGFAGFTPVKRHQMYSQGELPQGNHLLCDTTSSTSSSNSSSNSSSSSTSTSTATHNHRKRGVEDAFPMPPSGTFRTGGVALMDQGQGFAGFTPMKRTRLQQQQQQQLSSSLSTSTFGLEQQQRKKSPDENRQPLGGVLSTVSGNKRGRLGSNGSADVVMQCASARKRGHVSTAADVELDRPVFSKRYVTQIEQHLKNQKQTYETKLRRDCAAEIAAVKAKAARTAADTSSRIALENERLRHENFVLKQGVRIQDDRNKKLQTKIAQLEHANYALCLRNVGGGSTRGGGLGNGNDHGSNGDVY